MVRQGKPGQTVFNLGDFLKTVMMSKKQEVV